MQSITARVRHRPKIDVALQGREMAIVMGTLLAVLADLIGSSLYPPGFATNDKSVINA
jgi:hypothetical protein